MYAGAVYQIRYVFQEQETLIMLSLPPMHMIEDRLTLVIIKLCSA